MNNEFVECTMSVIEAIKKYKEKHGEDGVIEEYYKNHGTYKDIEDYLKENECNK